MRSSYVEAKRSSENNDRTHVSPRLADEDGVGTLDILRSCDRLSSIVDRRSSRFEKRSRRGTSNVTGRFRVYPDKTTGFPLVPDTYDDRDLRSTIYDHRIANIWKDLEFRR